MGVKKPSLPSVKSFNNFAYSFFPAASAAALFEKDP